MSAPKKLIIAAVLALSATAIAQEAPHDSDHGERAHPAGAPTEQNVNANETPAGTAHSPGHGDPTKHFNFANKWWSYRKYDVYGGPLGDGRMVDPHTGQVVMDSHHPDRPAEEEPMSPPFVLMLVNFGLLLLILAKFGGPVAKKLAQERHDQIKTALDEAAKLREQAAQKLAEYETRIKDVDVEVKKLVDGIRADAEADKKRILEAAAAQAAQMKKDAEQRIAAEIELARTQLTREVAAAAAGATEKLLKDKVTADDQNKLVATFIGNVQSGPAKEAR